jgi:predicted TIM-barrel fold metal-dependent hydrolase
MPQPPTAGGEVTRASSPAELHGDGFGGDPSSADDPTVVAPPDVPGGVVDPFAVLKLGSEMEGVPMPRESLRDDESLAVWPSTDLAGYLFKRDADRASRDLVSHDLDAWLTHLDEFGIGLAQVPIPASAPNELFDRLAVHGDRVFLSIRVDPHDGMKAVRRIRDLARRYPNVRSISISPHMLYPFVAPNEREYFPIYVAAIEEHLAMFMNVGFPAPRVPASIQDPIHLDDVCWFFPELTVVMRHGGEPWVSTCVKMLLRWPNLYYATTAFAPRYYPPEILHLLRTRGADKVIWAGYWPMLSYERLFRELRGLDLSPAVATKFFSNNARVAFGLPGLPDPPEETT